MTHNELLYKRMMWIPDPPKAILILGRELNLCAYSPNLPFSSEVLNHP